MNWVEVKKEYPNAFKIWCLWITNDYSDDVDFDIQPISRFHENGWLSLVYFFDEQDIYISVIHNEVARKFYYDISTKPMSNDISSKVIYARSEAETAGFDKAFEILEASN